MWPLKIGFLGVLTGLGQDDFGRFAVRVAAELQGRNGVSLQLVIRL